MTRLSERLKEIGITDPGADGDPADQLRQLEEARKHIDKSIRRTKERQERDRAKIAEELRQRRERWEAENRKRQELHGRVAAYYRSLGIHITAGPIAIDCWSARCTDRRRSGVTLPPSMHVDLEGGAFWCEACPARGGLAEAAEAFNRDPVELLRCFGFGDQADLLERRRKAVAAIDGTLARIGRNHLGYGDLRTARDRALREDSLEELERVASEAKNMRKDRS
jgi:hypothetical protein